MITHDETIIAKRMLLNKLDEVRGALREDRLTVSGYLETIARIFDANLLTALKDISDERETDRKNN